MSIVGNKKQCVIANGATDSAKVNLGGHFSHVSVKIPTITSANLSLKVSQDFNEETYTTLGNGLLYVSAGTGGFYDVWALGGSYCAIQIISSVAQEAERTFEVTGVDI